MSFPHIFPAPLVLLPDFPVQKSYQLLVALVPALASFPLTS